jgi:hypothetical protein
MSDWKDMHWEKVSIMIGGKNVLKEQLDELNRHDISIRLVRARQKDGKEVLYYEKLVR